MLHEKGNSWSNLQLPLAFLFILVVLALVEFRTHLVEKAAGHYLNMRNQGREAWGRSWERQRSAREAARKLDEKAVESAKLRSRAELVSDFGELFAVIPEGEGVPISPAKFVELYLTLPSSLQSGLVEPSELVNLYWRGNWSRTSVWRRGEDITAYLVDARNRVIRNVTVSPALITAVEIHGRLTTGLLSDNTAFSGNIFSAQRFFDAFWKLSQLERDKIIPDPDFLLKLPRPVVRVGFASLPEAPGFTVIGFESESRSSTIVTSFPVYVSVLGRLRWLLAWADSDTIFNKQDNPDSTFVGDDRIGLGDKTR